MGNNTRPVNSIDFLKKLPAFYAQDYGDDQLFRRFLMQFEEMFDRFQSTIAGDALTLTYRDPGADKRAAGGAGKKTETPRYYKITVDLFDAGHIGYPRGSLVFIQGDPDVTTLAEPIAADSENNSFIMVTDRTFPPRLKDGDKFIVRTNRGLAGLTAISEMPPSSYKHLEDKNFAYLQYLASWVGLPLRSDKPVSWNRRFLREAVALDNNAVLLDPKTFKLDKKSGKQRSTLPGLKALLDSWHQEEADRSKTIVTDLLSPANYTEEQEQVFRQYYGENFRTVCRLDESRIGIDTLLGEGEPGHFHVYLTSDPTDVYTRQPKNLDAMAAAAELILNLEKPVGTEYTLHISAHTMQLAPDLPIAPYGSGKASDASSAVKTQAEAVTGAEAGEAASIETEEELAVKDTNTFARIGVTTLLWDD